MNSDPSDFYDVIIIGGGPAGLSAALILGRSCRNAVLIDAGEPRNAAAHEIHGLLGRDTTNPRDLVRDGRKELAKYGVAIIDDAVTSAEKLPISSGQRFRTSFVVTTERGHLVRGRKLLFGTGMRDELPDLTGLRECYGYSVHHCPYCDGWEHRNKQLIAYSEQADSAVGLGLMLRGWSERVMVLTNGQSTTDEQERRLSANGIAFSDSRIHRLVHDREQLQAIQFQSGRTVQADAMFFNSGRHPTCTIPLSLGCELDDDASTSTNRKQKTDVPGVFLAGDAAGDVQFVVVAAAEGATAAAAINRELQEEDRL